jgi:hypothetical protein
LCGFGRCFGDWEFVVLQILIIFFEIAIITELIWFCGSAVSSKVRAAVSFHAECGHLAGVEYKVQPYLINVCGGIESTDSERFSTGTSVDGDFRVGSGGERNLR